MKQLKKISRIVYYSASDDVSVEGPFVNGGACNRSVALVLYAPTKGHVAATSMSEPEKKGTSPSGFTKCFFLFFLL